LVLAIPFDVLAKFRKPVVLIGLGCGSDFAVWMSVPKASMNKDNGSVFGQNDVRLSRELSITGPIYSEPVT